ncbi:MAG: serine protease [Armatimonadetes bacterium]|nr:serine protease [Armatimonadota bacterium]
MVLSAASTLALVTVFAAPDEDLQKVWKLVSSGLVSVTTLRGGSGFAVLIDSKGHFIIASSLVDSDKFTGVLGDGRRIILEVVNQDDFSQLTLLYSQDADGKVHLTPIRLATAMKPNDLVVAGLPSGPARGQWVSGERLGITKPSQRFIPLSELKFEKPTDRFGGAPVFNARGELVAIVGATLEPVQETANTDRVNGGATLPPAAKLETFGPVGLTVAYSASPSLLGRVVEGFEAPDHTPKHPTIGAFFSDSDGGGARVISVTPASPAAQAGLQADDTILKLDETPIENRFDLVKALFQEKVGNKVVLTIRPSRQSQLRKISVVIGSQLKSSVKKLEVADLQLNRSTPLKSVKLGLKH